MARLRSDFWVSAYLRRCNAEGAPAVLRHRGSPEAGAIFVVVDRLDASQALYGPAPQSLADPMGERLFVKIAEGSPPDILAKLERERRFDSDLWVIDVEDRAGEPRLPLATEN